MDTNQTDYMSLRIELVVINAEFRLADGQLNFKVNGYDLAVNLWNTRAKIVDNSEDVNSFVI